MFVLFCLSCFMVVDVFCCSVVWSCSGLFVVCFGFGFDYVLVQLEHRSQEIEVC